MRFTHTRLLGALALTMALAGSAAAVPVAIPYTGQVTDNGAPVNGQLGSVLVRLYAAPDGPGAAFWTSDPYTNVPVSGGTFTLVLAAGNPISLDSAILSRELIWAELVVNGNALSPRQKLMAVPAAARATEAAALGGVGAVHYIQEGQNAIFDSLAVTGNVSVGGTVKLGTTSDACVAGGAGTLRYWNGSLSYCNGTSWVPLLDSGNAVIDWSMITGLPAGFADGIDNESPTYFAGLGLFLSANTFHIDDAVIQRRVPTNCGTSAISAVASDGSAVCIPVGQTYTAFQFGGLELSANLFRLLSGCVAGQTLKFNGTSWACADDKVANSFAQLTGTATDAQVPDDITVNFAQDTDMVDGHPYSPIWDSTDYLTLGGFPESWYAKSSVASTIDAKLTNLANATPNQMATLCGNYAPTKVCKRDVYLASNHMRDETSLMMLSGGSWVYYAEANRCEYMGGVETANAKECGFGLMPDWIDTSDDCGGFRQSRWDSRVWFAVSKSNQWNPESQYSCPAGFVPMTVEQGKKIFIGPQNAGNTVYSSQCGWSSNTWNGKTNLYFRFADSKQYGWATKQADSWEGRPITTNSSLTQFGGIICWDTRPQGPTDWMDRSDLCGGFRQSTFDPRFRFAVSRKNVYDEDANYQCPEGYHWATTAEAYEVFFKEQSNLNTQSTPVYNNQCGWNGYTMNDGLARHLFRFSDSFQGITTQATMHAAWGDEYSVQFDIPRGPVSHAGVSSSYHAGIVCKADEDPSPDDLAWMDTTDYCGGWRQDTWDPRFYFAVSKSWVWDRNKDYACPVGYKWATRDEWMTAHPGTSTGINDQRVYSSQCGWNGYVWNGNDRRNFRFADSNTPGATFNWYIDANHPENYVGTTNTNDNNFAGIVCMKIGELGYPNQGTLDWMQTDDDCMGFKPVYWNPKLRLAVSRQNVWRRDFQYSCPTGYHWANSWEAQALLVGATTSNSDGNNPWYKYRNQCGWDSSTVPQWQGRARLHFRFADSSINDRFYGSNDWEQSGFSTDSATGNFAGIVCIADNLSEGPLDWWDRSDNCRGFRQSPYEADVYFMMARQNVWDPNRVYQCPAGYRWMSSTEYDQRFESSGDWDGHYNSSSFVQQYKYYDECGWNGYLWRNYYRWHFRFSDSAINGRHEHAGHLDPHRTTGADFSTNFFAGIVCVAEAGTFDPLTNWIDTTDNCGGWRQSAQHPDIYYAKAKSDMWDPNRVYTCPAGFYWATEAQYNSVRNQLPQLPSGGATSIYDNRCGWNSNTWNPAWRLGCNSYGNEGCGSGWLSPMPSAQDVLLDAAKPANQRDFWRGCDECDSYASGSTCNSSTLSSGADGKCGGINEVRWRNGGRQSGCFESPNVFSGTPAGVVPGGRSNHCIDVNGQQVCCSNGIFRARTLTQYKLRFLDSGLNPATLQFKGTGTHTGMNTGSNDGASMSLGSSDISHSPGNGWFWGHIGRQFAGIICIRNTNVP